MGTGVGQNKTVILTQKTFDQKSRTRSRKFITALETFISRTFNK